MDSGVITLMNCKKNHFTAALILIALPPCGAFCVYAMARPASRKAVSSLPAIANIDEQLDEVVMSGEGSSYGTDVFVFISQLAEEFDGKSLPVNGAERLLCRAGYVDGVRRMVDLLEEKNPQVLSEIIESFGKACNYESKEAIVIGNTIDNRSIEERNRIDLTKCR